MYITTNSSWLEHVWTFFRPDDDPNDGVETCCQTNKSIKKRRPIWLRYSCVLWLSHTFNILQYGSCVRYIIETHWTVSRLRYDNALIGSLPLAGTRHNLTNAHQHNYAFSSHIRHTHSATKGVLGSRHYIRKRKISKWDSGMGLIPKLVTCATSSLKYVQNPDGQRNCFMGGRR